MWLFCQKILNNIWNYISRSFWWVRLACLIWLRAFLSLCNMLSVHIAFSIGFPLKTLFLDPETEQRYCYKLCRQWNSSKTCLLLCCCWHNSLGKPRKGRFAYQRSKIAELINLHWFIVSSCTIRRFVLNWESIENSLQGV